MTRDRARNVEGTGEIERLLRDVLRRMDERGYPPAPFHFWNFAATDDDDDDDE